MSLCSRTPKPSAVSSQLICPHRDLAPRWATAADMGKNELITHYQCCTCGAEVSREDALKSA